MLFFFHYCWSNERSSLNYESHFKIFFFQVLYTAIVLYGPSLTLESGKKVFGIPTENIYMCRK